jgi:molybdopterin synthase sulfur carrier subunit
MPQVVLKKPLRPLTNGNEFVEVRGETINDVFNQLEARFPGFRDKMCEKNGELHRFINVFVDGENVRCLDLMRTSVSETSRILLATGIAGA